MFWLVDRSGIFGGHRLRRRVIDDGDEMANGHALTTEERKWVFAKKKVNKLPSSIRFPGLNIVSC